MTAQELIKECGEARGRLSGICSVLQDEKRYAEIYELTKVSRVLSDVADTLQPKEDK